MIKNIHIVSTLTIKYNTKHDQVTKIIEQKSLF